MQIENLAGNVKVLIAPEEIIVRGSNWEYKLNKPDETKVFDLISNGKLYDAAHKALSAYYEFCNHYQSC